MKLNEYQADPNHNETILNDLRLLLKQPDYKDLRPCDGCTRPCPCSASATCTCACAPNCEHAPVEMSSEADRYPIESHIATMVFGFNTLRVCPPYWSCEGHTFAGGEIRRVPQVWFYARSLIYPKLVGEYVLKLKTQGLLEYPWQIVMTHTDNVLETGFSIEPETRSIAHPDIAVMRKDANTIAANLQSGLKAIATRYIEEHTRKEARARLDALEKSAKYQN
ncbi:MAG: hypothetical protein OEZ23_01425 [Gammaproteobacteria bacterium]|nr:hypothetical protein [Gammaproteobacteria bacterium]